jgi:hypothetical protein
MRRAATAREQRADPLPHQLPANAGKFSLIRALRSLERSGKLDGLEAEVTSEIERRTGEVLGGAGLYLPWDAEVRNLDTNAAAGGIATIVKRPVIDVLRARCCIGLLGATFLNDLAGAGEVDIPKRTSTISLGWFNDDIGPAQQSSQTISSKAIITPYSTGAYSDVSRRFWNVVTDAEALTVEDLISAIGVEVDRVTLNGPGNNANGPQPLGLFQSAEVVAGASLGANGGPPTHAALCALEQAIGNANAERNGPLGFLTSVNGRAKMRQTETVTGTGRFLWKGNNTLSTGHRAEATTQVPSNITKGSGTNLTLAVLGNWPDLVIGTWGAIKVLVNPYTFGPATIRITAYLDIGTALKHGESFSKLQDMSTS